jgi:DNA-binding NtrC family response regulator
MTDILVVDDDQSVASAFRQFLAYEGHRCRLASNAEEAIRLIAERQPALVMMDNRMPGVDGLGALMEIRQKFPGVYVVMMTGYGTSQTSIDAIRAGAFDYLTKPLDLDELREVIQKVEAAQQIVEPKEATALSEAASIARLVGDVPAMRDVYKIIGRLAAIDVPALIVGEHGSGKHLVVATIHENSSRRDEPFQRIDCVEADVAVLQAALFNDARGTLHLSGIESLQPAIQLRLADSLSAPRRREGPGVRIIGSTERNLEELVANGTFNRDLYAALALITVRLPPLRARREDIPLLARHFVQRFNAEFDRTIKGLDDNVLRLLESHSWPGNVGELERVIKRGSILARSDVITADDIGDSLSRRVIPGQKDAESALAGAARTALQERLVNGSAVGPSSVYHDIVEVVEAALVQEALTITNGNQVKAAGILGVNRTTLRKKMPPES